MSVMRPSAPWEVIRCTHARALNESRVAQESMVYRVRQVHRRALPIRRRPRDDIAMSAWFDTATRGRPQFPFRSIDGRQAEAFAA